MIWILPDIVCLSLQEGRLHLGRALPRVRDSFPRSSQSRAQEPGAYEIEPKRADPNLGRPPQREFRNLVGAPVLNGRRPVPDV